jgi:hypothetical protein
VLSEGLSLFFQPFKFVHYYPYLALGVEISEQRERRKEVRWLVPAA